MSYSNEIKRVVETYFDPVPGRSSYTELVFICPMPGCGDVSGNRSVNLLNGKTSCWRCGKRIQGSSGDFVMWCRRLGIEIDDISGSQEVSISETERLLNQMDGESFVPYTSNVNLPGGFTHLAEEPDSAYFKLIERMAIRKRLDVNDMIKASVGFTRTTQKWEPYAIFPVREFGRLVYFQGRTYTDEPGKPTKRFPDKTECPYGSANWVYNLDSVRERKPKLVVVNESILNVVSLEKCQPDFVPVCVFKHFVSPPQLQKLSSFHFIEEICMLYDPDATKDAWIEAGRKLSNRLKVSIATMQGGDANDNVDEAMEAIANRKKYTPAGELEAML